MSTYRRKRIVLLDESKAFIVTPLSGQLQVALYCDMGRTCSLAWSRARVVAIDPVHISIIVCPHVLRPKAYRLEADASDI